MTDREEARTESIGCPVCGMSTRIVREYEGARLVECVNPVCDTNLPPVTEEERT